MDEDDEARGGQALTRCAAWLSRQAEGDLAVIGLHPDGQLDRSRETPLVHPDAGRPAGDLGIGGMDADADPYRVAQVVADEHVDRGRLAAECDVIGGMAAGTG